VHVKAVRAHQQVAGLEVGADIVAIDVALKFVRQKDIDEVTLGSCFGG
jgi:hypothetical protein